MTSSDLFSHPYEPEFFPNSERAAEPVKAPVFSDRDPSDSTSATPPTS